MRIGSLFTVRRKAGVKTNLPQTVDKHLYFELVSQYMQTHIFRGDIKIGEHVLPIVVMLNGEWSPTNKKPYLVVLVDTYGRKP